MTSVITAGNSEGTYGRCDAKCHKAAGASCRCICGGLYHGSLANGQEDLERRRGEFGRQVLEDLYSKVQIVGRPVQPLLL